MPYSRLRPVRPVAVHVGGETLSIGARVVCVASSHYSVDDPTEAGRPSCSATFGTRGRSSRVAADIVVDRQVSGMTAPRRDRSMGVRVRPNVYPSHVRASMIRKITVPVIGGSGATVLHS